MKRLISFLLALTLLGCVFAAAEDEADGDDSNPVPLEAAEEEDDSNPIPVDMMEDEELEIEEEINSRSKYKQKIEEIKDILLKAENEASKNMIDYAFINKYIDKIYVTPIDDGKVDITVKIFSGDTVEKHLSALRKRHKSIKNAQKNDKITSDNESANENSRPGHTFKKMIESYENSMK